jgi:SAM-dependent methyltransferase
MSWSEIHDCEELNAVLWRRGTERQNLMMHAPSLWAAKAALKLARRGQERGLILDFGCGVGRIARVFHRNGHAVIGTEVTMEMLSAARRFQLPQDVLLTLTDGVAIPLQDRSVDLIWACGVLKYSLFPPDAPCRGGTPEPGNTKVFVPVYGEIVKEMFRVLRPGGFVVNYEMWVDSPPNVFMADFESRGFQLKKPVRILRRYEGRLERFCQWRPWHRLPPKLVMVAGWLCATARFWCDNPRRSVGGFHDYLFVWSKPAT